MFLLIPQADAQFRPAAAIVVDAAIDITRLEQMKCSQLPDPAFRDSLLSELNGCFPYHCPGCNDCELFCYDLLVVELFASAGILNPLGGLTPAEGSVLPLRPFILVNAASRLA